MHGFEGVAAARLRLRIPQHERKIVVTKPSFSPRGFRVCQLHAAPLSDPDGAAAVAQAD